MDKWVWLDWQKCWPQASSGLCYTNYDPINFYLSSKTSICRWKAFRGGTPLTRAPIKRGEILQWEKNGGDIERKVHKNWWKMDKKSSYSAKMNLSQSLVFIRETLMHKSVRYWPGFMIFFQTPPYFACLNFDCVTNFALLQLDSWGIWTNLNADKTRETLLNYYTNFALRLCFVYIFISQLS